MSGPRPTLDVMVSAFPAAAERAMPGVVAFVKHLEDAHGWECFEDIYILADALRQHSFDHHGGTDMGHVHAPNDPWHPGDTNPHPGRAGEHYVTVTVKVPVQHPDGCDVATVVGDVRESLLEPCSRFAVRHAGVVVTVAGASLDPDAAYSGTVTVGSDDVPDFAGLAVQHRDDDRRTLDAFHDGPGA